MRCSRPVFVPFPAEKFSLPRYSFLPASFTGFTVPCGKCVSCVKSRQDDFACRVARCASEYGNMIFVTFTYRDDTLPISCRLYQVDTFTGDTVFSYGRINLDSDCPYLSSIRERFASMLPGRRSRYITQPAPFPDQDGLSYFYEFTPSLDRSSFRLWLKNERVKYKRLNGVSLPDFKYCVVGEYGPRTCRPHLHACFMGLSYEIVNQLCDSWRLKYGFVHIQAVKRINPDGSSGLLAASRYVGKYISKGVCECDSVVYGLSEKPRICASLNMGTQLSLGELWYYSAYDLYGVYDPDRLIFTDGTPLSSSQLSHIQHEVFIRSKITVDGHSFVLPKAIRDKIWKFESNIYSSNGKLSTTKPQGVPSKIVKRSLLTHKIRFMAAVSSSVNLLRYDSVQLHAYLSRFPEREAASRLSEYYDLQDLSAASQEAFRVFSFKAGYSHSLF